MTNNKICYLHIGTHKTGSTSIQRCLRSSHEKLRDSGIALPLSSSMPLTPYHRDIAVALKTLPNHGGDTEILRNLGSMLRNEDRDIIITAELLSEQIVRPRVFSKVKDFFKELGYGLHVIVYLRDQPSYINSRYVQDIKRFKYGGSIQQRIEDIFSGEMPSYDYWNHYQALMSDPDITFDPRSFSKAVKTGLIKDFFSTMPSLRNAEWIDSYLDGKHQNPNAGVKTVCAARLAYEAINSSEPRLLKRRLSDYFDKAFKKKNWSEEPFIGLDDEVANRITSHFAEGNDRLALKYWNCKWSDLNPPQRWTPKVFDFANASPKDQEEIMELVAKLVRLYNKPESTVSRQSRRQSKTKE